MLCSVSQTVILQYYFSLTLKFCWTLSVVKVGCKSISITVKIKVSGYDISYVSPEPDKKWRWVRRSIFSMRQETRDNMASWRMNWKWDSTQSAVSTTLHCTVSILLHLTTVNVFTDCWYVLIKAHYTLEQLTACIPFMEEMRPSDHHSQTATDDRLQSAVRGVSVYPRTMNSR